MIHMLSETEEQILLSMFVIPNTKDNQLVMDNETSEYVGYTINHVFSEGSIFYYRDQSYTNGFRGKSLTLRVSMF